MLLTDETIRQICPKAANIVIIRDPIAIQVGICVGLFSMAATVTAAMDEETQRRTVRNLYMDLVMMNRHEDEQQRQAAEEAHVTGR